MRMVYYNYTYTAGVTFFHLHSFRPTPTNSIIHLYSSRFNNHLRNMSMLPVAGSGLLPDPPLLLLDTILSIAFIPSHTLLDCLCPSHGASYIVRGRWVRWELLLRIRSVQGLISPLPSFSLLLRLADLISAFAFGEFLRFCIRAVRNSMCVAIGRGLYLIIIS